MIKELKEYFKASAEYNKHKAEIDRYNKAWAKVNKEDKPNTTTVRRDKSGY